MPVIHILSRTARGCFLGVFGIALSGCISTAVMLDPKTGSVHQCQPGNQAFPIAAQHALDTCVSAYERLGWKKQ